MKKVKVCVVTVLAICLAAVCAVEVFAEANAKDESGFTIRKTAEEVVLYTIHRGGYAETGQAVGDLYALAGKKGISTRGAAYYVYLNNSGLVSSTHWLTEIRIPVSREALKLSGTLGDMTDIKALPAMEVAVAVKPEGQTNPCSIYRHLRSWIGLQGYSVADSPREAFLTNWTTDDYSRMKTEITIPIQKLPTDSD